MAKSLVDRLRSLPIPKPSAEARVRIKDLQTTTAARLGLSPAQARDAQRVVLWWTWARAQAVLNRRPLLRGWGIGWTAMGYGELLPVEVPRAGRGRVTVLVSTSAISPGTERAQYLRLPNASRGMFGTPGYSAAGVAIAVGPGVEGISEGDLVAVSGTPHASVVTALSASVFPVPVGVVAESAALIHLGIICGGAVRAARLAQGESFVVLGAGAIGALAQRLARSEGARCQAVIARSSAKEASARAGGTERFLTTGGDAEEIGRLAAPVVIEATGDPEAIHVAVAAAGHGARVVLLGSSRGSASSLPLDAIRDKQLEIVGAHVSALKMEAERAPADPRRAQGERFLARLEDGTVSVEDLVGPAVDPREAPLFYRELASRRDLVGAHFDWTRLRDGERSSRGRLLQPPAVRGHGLDYQNRPLAPAGLDRLTRDLVDPFAGAQGRLRIGLMGAGDIGVENAVAATLAPNVELTACFDPNPRLAQAVADRFGCAAALSAEALLDRQDVDAVFLCVPHHLHAPLAIQAARAGKHVIVEKPQANTLAAAVEMTDEAERAGVALSICFPYRYEPEVIVARRLIEAGVLGEFRGVHIRLLADKTPVYWAGGYSGRSHSDWRASREKAGGGVLIMNATHYIDLIHDLVGVEAEEVFATAGVLDAAMDVEDFISVGARFPQGARGSILSCSVMRGMLSREFRLWGDDGQVAIEPSPRVYTLRAVDGLRTSRWQTFGALPGGARFRSVYLSRLATDLHQGRPPEVGADAGLAVQAFIEAAYRSAELGQAVRPADLIAEARA